MPSSRLLDGIAPKGDLFYAATHRAGSQVNSAGRDRAVGGLDGGGRRRREEPKKIDIAGTINKSNIYTVLSSLNIHAASYF